MNKSLSYSLIAFIIINFLCTSAAAREQVDRVVAVINDKIITLTEYEEQAKLNGVTLGDIETNFNFLEQIIDKTIIEQEAKKIGVVVTDAEVEGTIQEMQSYYNINKTDIEKSMKEQNITEEGFKEQWKFQLMTRRLVQREIKGSIAITDEEIAQYYKKTYGDELETGNINEFEIAHILISSDTPQMASQIAERARQGENFAKLAKNHSQDAMSASSGGVLGYFKKGDLVEPLDQAVHNAKVNEIVGPVESPAGFHIIKILNRQEIKNGISKTYSNEIRAILYNQKAEEILKNYLIRIKNSAYIERKL